MNRATCKRSLLTLGAGVVMAASTTPLMALRASGASVPQNPPLVFVARYSPAEIGLTNAYGTATVVINVSGAGGVANPVISPDGTKIAFSANCTIYTVNTNGSGLATLPNSTGGCAEHPAWSPNSAQLAFDAYSAGSQSLWVSNADGSGSTEMAPGGTQPSWAPNGNRIVFVELSSQGEALATVASSGGSATVLTTVPAGVGIGGQLIESPVWSPDGSTIAYISASAASTFSTGSLALINANGTQNRRVAGTTANSSQAVRISWCPSGLCVLAGNSLFSGLGNPAALPVASTNGGVSSSIPIDGTDAAWIGVQGPIQTVSPPPPTTGAASTASGQGFWTAGTDGGIFTYGDAQFSGSMGGRPLNQPVVGMAATPSGKGYWEVASDGGIFSFGDAQFDGLMGGRPLNKPVVGMVADPATGGYWEVASDGGIFGFNAPFLGSTGSIRLNQPVVGMAATPDGGGYWLVASDGGIFAYGDAVFSGSMGGTPLNAPVTAMTPSSGGGYWLVAADGGIFSFSSATFRGSVAGVAALAQPVISLVPSASTGGYREVTAGGGMFNFSAPLG